MRTMASEREDVARRWREAEERLYPVVSVRPDLYQAAVALVRSLADHLGAIPDRDALVTSYLASTAGDDLAAAGLDGDVPPGLDPGLVRGAAYQVRSRELEQREARERAARAIARARRRGEPTAIVWTSGASERWPPWREVEMSVTTGFAVVRSTEIDPDTMGPRFVIEAVQLDPEDGGALDEPPLAPRRELTDFDAWQAAAAELRRRLLLPTEEGPDATA